MNELSFEISAGNSQARAIVPLIDSIALTDLISSFETEKSMEPSGGYGGLVPAYYKYGPLDHYFMGDTRVLGLSDNGKVALLGCECGEVGCWALLARVIVDGQYVHWTDFEQPHRSARDYSSFGPFTFEKPKYLQVLQELIQQLTR